MLNDCGERIYPDTHTVMTAPQPRSQGRFPSFSLGTRLAAAVGPLLKFPFLKTCIHPRCNLGISLSFPVIVALLNSSGLQGGGG